ncbi:MAG TPA: phosphatidate cytidylyltransferase [Gammaproteobacteria bacterium]|nr:phosphatidate cytidylyltransferase [Gammaproteobacteria bacterium]
MLKQRLLTALVAIPIVVALALFAPRGVVAAVLGIIVLAGAWEWTAFAGYSATSAKWAYLLLVGALLVGCGFTLLVPNLAGAVIVVGAAWWLLVTVGVTAYGLGHAEAHISGISSWLISLCGLLTLVPAWEAVVAIRGMVSGPGLLFFMLVLIWVADSGAYAAGRLWGRRRLAPRISPGKTWEGVAGGLAAAAIVGVAGSLFFGFSLAVFVPVCILTAAFSIIGDLSESLFKRLIGIKDSGTLFPGHGGVLDRFDSLSAAAPVFYVCLWALGL